MRGAGIARKPARSGIGRDHTFTDRFIQGFVNCLNLRGHFLRIFFFDALARSFDEGAKLGFCFRVSRPANHTLAMPFDGGRMSSQTKFLQKIDWMFLSLEVSHVNEAQSGGCAYLAWCFWDNNGKIAPAMVFFCRNLGHSAELGHFWPSQGCPVLVIHKLFTELVGTLGDREFFTR
jgi:hypothetical protein